MNIDKVKLEDKLATKGIEYYETSRGIFITKLNNDIAKLQDFPPTYDGKEVLSNTLFDPFPKDKTDENNLGFLANKIKYRANRNLQKTWRPLENRPKNHQKQLNIWHYAGVAQR